ncbi:MAG: hypothetical protein ABS98_16910 [Lysobacteraceae bacterium SCN 69-48]|nr:MAG: hypothetical protein ABS98_16910 [Xanthomonadaceae bacterium SCN 69-48]
MFIGQILEEFSPPLDGKAARVHAPPGDGEVEPEGARKLHVRQLHRRFACELGPHPLKVGLDSHELRLQASLLGAKEGTIALSEEPAPNRLFDTSEDLLRALASARELLAAFAKCPPLGIQQTQLFGEAEYSECTIGICTLLNELVDPLPLTEVAEP